MPGLLKLYLSYYIVPILIGLYLLGAVLVLIGFRRQKIQRRKDVIMRGALMHGTYIFLSHGIGLIMYCIMYIMMRINGVEIEGVSASHLLIVLVAVLTSNVSYYLVSIYLWSRLAISRLGSMNLTRNFLIFVTPWYFFFNM